MNTGKWDFTMIDLDLRGVGEFARRKGLLERDIWWDGVGRLILAPIFGGFRARNHLVSE